MQPHTATQSHQQYIFNVVVRVVVITAAVLNYKCQAGGIRCDGAWSCANVGDIEAPYGYIVCSGDHSCFNSTISNTKL